MSLSKASFSKAESNTQNYITVCGICLSTYEVPKGLPCLHTFCLGCIREWASHVSTELEASGSQMVSCPNCRKEFVLPATGVDGLPTNFFITERNQVDSPPVCNCCGNGDREIVARCCECGFVCEECTGSHQTMRPLKNHSVIMLDTLRVGKTEEKLAKCRIKSDEVRRPISRCGRFNLEKTINLKSVKIQPDNCTIISTKSSTFEIAVPTDHPSGKVYVFGIDSQVKLTIDTKEGLLPGISSSPYDVAIMPPGDDFYITDSGNPRVSIHNKSGQFVSQLQLVDINGLACTSGRAVGIAIDETGQIIVGEGSQKTISIYKSDTAFVTAFKVDMYPNYIATAKSGGSDILLVNDNASENTLVIDYSGMVLKSITSPSDDVKWNPRGIICCSRTGEIFVANGVTGGKGCVCRYTDSWQYTGCVISDLENPYGIAISEDGLLLAVVDTYHKLKIFRRT